MLPVHVGVDVPPPGARPITTADVLASVTEAVILSDVYIVAICAFRFLAPFASFTESRALLWLVGPVGVALVQRFRPPFELVKALLKSRGLDVDATVDRWTTIPPVDPRWMIGLVPAGAALLLFFAWLTPLAIVETDRTPAPPCQPGYIVQPYVHAPNVDSQTRSDAFDTVCDDSKGLFSGTFEQVRIRNGIWPNRQAGTLVIKVAGGLIDGARVPATNAGDVAPNGEMKPPARADLTLKVGALGSLEEAVYWVTTERSVTGDPVEITATLTDGGETYEATRIPRIGR